MPVLELGDDPADVPQARHWVLSRCVESGLEEDARFAVELVTSELVANAYQHGLPPVTVAVDRAEAAPEGPRRLVIGVTDRGPGAPVVKEFDDEALGGRGMALVESLTAEWGVAPASAGPGKTVWCRLAG